MYKLKALAVHLNGVTYKLDPKNPMMFDTSKGGKFERLKAQVEAAEKGGFLEKVSKKEILALKKEAEKKAKEKEAREKVIAELAAKKIEEEEAAAKELAELEAAEAAKKEEESK